MIAVAARLATRLARSPLAALAAFVVVGMPAAASAQSSHEHRWSRISEAHDASEYWDIVARFDSNHTLFVRFMITNEGPGAKTAVATWYLVEPDGEVISFRNGRRRARWTLSPDGGRIKLGSSVFDQRGDVHSLEYDSKKRKIQVHLRFSPRLAPTRTTLPGDGGYAMDVLDLGTPVVGTLQVKDMAEPLRVNGTLSVTHTSVEVSEPEAVLRRIEFTSTIERGGLYLSELTTPSGQRHRWLVVEHEGRVFQRSSDFEIEAVVPGSAAKEDYPVPSEIRLRGEGVEGTITTGAVLVAADPLEMIPQPFRFLLSFKMRPYRIWTDASCDIRLRTDPNLPPVSFRAPGVATINYLNPLPPNFSMSRTGSQEPRS